MILFSEVLKHKNITIPFSLQLICVQHSLDYDFYVYLDGLFISFSIIYFCVKCFFYINMIILLNETWRQMLQ